MKLERSSMNQYFIKEPDGGMGGSLSFYLPLCGDVATPTPDGTVSFFFF